MLLYFFFGKVRVAMQLAAETCGCLKWKISLRLTWKGGCVYRSLWTILLHGAPLHALRTWESPAIGTGVHVHSLQSKNVDSYRYLQYGYLTLFFKRQATSSNLCGCKIQCSLFPQMQHSTQHYLLGMKAKFVILFVTYFLKPEIRVSQNPAKLGGEAHKMSGMEGGENWSKLCTLGRRVSTLAL